MQTGILSGLVGTTDQVCFDYEVTGSAVSSISTGNILNGNEDGWYTIIVRHINGSSGSYCMIYPNGDTGSNYGRRGFRASNSTVYINDGTAENYIQVGYGASSGVSSLWVCRVYAKSGTVRLFNEIDCDSVSGTTVGDMSAVGHVWNNSVDNITSFLFNGYGSASLGVGTRILILKSNNFTNGTPCGNITTPYIKGCWTRVGSTVLGSDASSVTFSGLNGDIDQVYMLSGSYKPDGNAQVLIRLNNDSATNYGNQALYAQSTTVGAGRNTAQSRWVTVYTTSPTIDQYVNFNTIIFAKTGFLRPMIRQTSSGISGTTIDNMDVYGGAYSDTSTNVTSINLPISAGNIRAGSQFQLYALKP